jgi:hypothetical protein
MFYTLIRHKVRDFSAWKKVYDAHAGMRDKAGLAEKFVLRSEDDPNEVIILLEAGDIARAKAFSESKDLHDKMNEAGVIDKPDVYFLHDESGAAAKAA